MMEKLFAELQDTMGLFVPLKSIKALVQESFGFPEDLNFNARLQLAGVVVFVKSVGDHTVVDIIVNGEEMMFTFSWKRDQIVLYEMWWSRNGYLASAMEAIDNKFSEWTRADLESQRRASRLIEEEYYKEIAMIDEALQVEESNN